MFGRGLSEVANGDILKGVERMSPKVMRDILRAARYYNEGLVNNAGDTVIPADEMGVGQIFAQAMGLQPDQISRFYQGQAAIKGAQNFARDRRSELMRRFTEARDRSGVLKEVQEFNRAYPSMRITRSTLIRGAQSRREREARYDRYGANIDDTESRDFAKYGDPYNF
jgi:hypothetical protein